MPYPQPEADPGAPAWPVSQVGPWLDVATRSIAVAAGIAYFLGLLVTTLHLQEFGGPFLGVFAVQYVAAGIWALYPFAVGATFSLILFTKALRWSQHESKMRRRLYNLGRATALGVFLLGLGFLPLSLLNVPLQSFRDFGAWIMVFAIGTWSTNPSGWRVKTPKEPRSGLPGERALALGFYGVLGLFALTYYCQLFTYAYRTIPAEWGGGSPALAHVLVRADLHDTLLDYHDFSAIGIGLEAQLLLLTNDLVLIAPLGSDRGILLQRSDVTLLGRSLRNQ